MKQTTLKKEVSFSGVAIHSGQETSIRLAPAEENYGIRLIKEGREIPALADQATDTALGTAVGGVKLTEHLFACLFALGIDNLKIIALQNEIPILDGSALPFYKKIIEAGLIDQKEEKRLLTVKEKIKIEDSGKSLTAMPFNGFKVDFMVDFAGIGRQNFVFEKGKNSFEKEIAPARTFGFVEELEELKKKGFAKGASLENALAISRQKGYVNQPRFKDEPVRHKVLDLMGDLLLAGKGIRGYFVAEKSGHKLNVAMARRLMETC